MPLTLAELSEHNRLKSDTSWSSSEKRFEYGLVDKLIIENTSLQSQISSLLSFDEQVQQFKALLGHLQIDVSQITVIGPTFETQPTLNLSPGQKVRFALKGRLPNGQFIQLPAIWQATAGVIDQSGNHTASSLLTSYKVIAKAPYLAWNEATAVLSILTIGSPSIPGGGGGIAALMEDDFGGYTDIDDYKLNGLYISEVVDSDSEMSLAAGGYGGASKHLLYTWQDRTAEGTTTGLDGYCTSHNINLVLAVPDAPKPHLWIEIPFKFSSDFDVGATPDSPPEDVCISTPEYKVFHGYAGGTGRFGWNVQAHRNNYDLPSTGFNGTDNPIPSSTWTGNWYLHRFEWKVSSATDVADALFRHWINGALDDRELLNQVVNRTGLQFLTIGVNMNQGPCFSGMSLGIGNYKVYDQDPGW